jgi:nitric oxide reductase NorQ protein
MTERAPPFCEPSGNEIALLEHAFRDRSPLLIKGLTGCEEKAA